MPVAERQDCEPPESATRGSSVLSTLSHALPRSM
jgi:hypothetical protein